MKVIDLLNDIANGEEVPKKIEWDNTIFDYYDSDYCAEGYSGLFEICVPEYINDEVEIIDTDYKDDKPITKESIEALGYACGEIKKLFESGWKKSIENKPLIEEDKKIEKADLPNYFEIGVDKHKDVEHIYKQCVKIHDNTVYLENKLNEIIDKINEEK